MDEIKSFKDLVFQPHHLAVAAQKLPSTAWEKDLHLASKMAVLNFENGYGVSVLFGSVFYSNGVDTYEVAVLLNGKYCQYFKVKGWVSADAVSDIMKEIQQLPKVDSDDEIKPSVR